MTSGDRPLSVNMKTAVSLLFLFTIAIIVALTVTVASTTPEVQLLALGLVGPQIILCVVFIYNCKKGRLWSYVGASILGALGVLLRVLISFQPNLEVGGGLPVGVTVIYIVLGALVSLKSYESALELWSQNL